VTSYTISGGTSSKPASVSASYAVLSLTSGDLLSTGSYDTLISGVSNVGIVLDSNFNKMILSGNNDSIFAGGKQPPAGGYGDTLLETGNDNQIFDAGFNDGGITLEGSYNTLTSGQRLEQAAVLIAGNDNVFTNSYLVADMTISGSYNTIDIGSGSRVTITGNHDTVTVLDAAAIVTTGDDEVINDDYFRDQPQTEGLALSASAAPASISIGGSGSSVTLQTNNVAVTVSGNSASVNAAGDLATVNASGNADVISADALLNSISVSGANSTVTTAVPQLAKGYESSASTGGGLTVTTVAFSGSASVGTVFNDGNPGEVTVSPSVPVALTLTTSQSAVNTLFYSTVTDQAGGNVLTVGGASVLNDVAGNDTVQVLNGTYLVTDSLSGANGANTVNFGINDQYNASSAEFVSSQNVLNLAGNDGAVIYAANQDTVNLNGAGNVLILEPNSSLADVAARASAQAGSSVVNVNGASTALVETAANSIVGANGAILVVTAGNNTITGQSLDAQISGPGNKVMLTGSDTLSSASPYQYLTGPEQMSVQNQLTVQSGQFSLGGLDALDQVSGTAAISLFGGNKVTLGGVNDSVTAGDQIYGGNGITVNGAGATITAVNTANAANTITANASTLVNMVDNTGSIIGAVNHNSSEALTFIAGTGSSNTIFGASSNAAITLFGGASAGNVVYGGRDGGNSLNGGSGGADRFVGGGNGDVLIGGTAGNNTLTAGAGNETLVGAGLGNDDFSVAGGGGSAVIQDFTGSLTVNSALSVSSQTDVGGSLVVTLSDATQITFAGLTNVNHTGNVFTLS
jgi:hypothetical protein